jgi:hypothetical protein
MNTAVPFSIGLLTLATAYKLAEACGGCCSTVDNTWVSNWSHQPIRATIDYEGSRDEHSDFINRLITPGNYGEFCFFFPTGCSLLTTIILQLAIFKFLEPTLLSSRLYGCTDHDEYASGTPIHVTLWVDGPNGVGNSGEISIDSDRSIVSYDHPDSTAVDIYLARCGTRIQIDSQVLVTIYPK